MRKKKPRKLEGLALVPWEIQEENHSSLTPKGGSFKYSILQCAISIIIVYYCIFLKQQRGKSAE